MIINVKFEENDKKFNAAVGETTVIHGGQNGATFTPSVSEDGVISWTNDKGLPNPAPVNLVKAVLAALGGDEPHWDTTSELGKAILNKMILA